MPDEETNDSGCRHDNDKLRRSPPAYGRHVRDPLSLAPTSQREQVQPSGHRLPYLATYTVQ